MTLYIYVIIIIYFKSIVWAGIFEHEVNSNVDELFVCIAVFEENREGSFGACINVKHVSSNEHF